MHIYKVLLVFEEDVKDICLVLEVFRVLQQLHQSIVVDGSAFVSGDAALRCDRHRRALENGRRETRSE